MADAITVYMARLDWREPGGPTGHLPILIEELAGRDDVTLRTFLYGNRRVAMLPRAVSRWLAVRLAITALDFLGFVLLCLRRGRPDVMHLNSAFERMSLLRDIPYLAFCRLFGVRSVVKTHGSDQALIHDRRALWRRAMSVYLRLADIVTLLSPVETREFRETFPDHAAKFATAKNIVQPPVRAETAPRRGAMLFAGRFVEKKNIPALLDAFARIAPLEPGAGLTMAGDGPLTDTLKSQAETLGIAARIDWRGWVDRKALAALNTDSQIVVFTSTGSEGMPMVLLEALRSRSVIVTTAVRFLRSYPMDGLGVVTLKGTTAEDIAEGMREALAMPPLTDAVLARRATYLEAFSREVVAEEFVRLYRSGPDAPRTGDATLSRAA